LDALFEKMYRALQHEVPDLHHVVVANVADFLPALRRLLAKTFGRVPRGKIVPMPGKTIVSLMDLLARRAPSGREVRPRPEDTCLIMYTGGTTGLPKGAELTHRNIVAFIEQYANWIAAERGAEVSYTGTPAFHISGFLVCAWSLAYGCTQVIIPDPRQTRRICRELARHRPTIIINLPHLYDMLVHEPAFKSLVPSVFENLKVCQSGGAPLPPETHRLLETGLGQGTVSEFYGMTETTGPLVANPVKGRKIGSVGVPWQHTRVKLVDLDTGTSEVPAGAEGEIIAQTPQLMKGYHDRSDETANVMRRFRGDRWIFTGDIGRMDEDGYLYVVGRTKDMIIGEYKVFPAEVEEVLSEHPAVEHCAVIGMPDPKRSGSELVKAMIQLAPRHKGQDTSELEKAIIEHCRGSLAAYKVPALVEIADQLPLTLLGKVDRKVLRARSGS
jgi:acyl-CoA synthetase (AMP-forming)/AMP-acid ligase II